MAIGDTMSQTVPAVGTPGTGYASQLVAFLQEAKARLTAKVPIASILIGLLDMANNAIQNLQYASFYPQSSTPVSPTASLQNYGGNLWWVSSSGAAQLTAGNSLNASAVAGIGGDYGGANPAAVRFDDANKLYNFYDDFGGLAWAYLDCRGVDVYGGLTSTTRVRITWPGSPSASWTLTLPTAPPASQQIMQMDAAGTVTVSNALLLNSNLTLSGTGKIAHGDKVLNGVPFIGSLISTSGVTGSNGTSPGVVVNASAVAIIHIPGITREQRVKSVSLDLLASPSNNVTYEILIGNSGGGGGFAFASGSVVNTSANPSVPTTTPYALAAGETLWIRVSTTTGAVTINAWDVTYDSV